MAENLLKNKVELTVYNRSEKPAEKLAEQGAQMASGLNDAVQTADIVFTMLSTPEVVGKMMLGEKGAISSMKKNALWVDCSTVDPSFSKKSASEAGEKSIRFIDAPVAGSKNKAENASLTFLVGGAKSDFHKIEPLLHYMGENIKYIGENGKGTSMKMLINAMLAQSMLIFSETQILGERMGFDKDFLLDMLPKLPVIAPFTKAKAELIREGNFDPHFPLEWMLKDLHLLAKTAKENNFKPQMADVAETLYREANQNNLGRKDFSVIYEYLKNRE